MDDLKRILNLPQMVSFRLWLEYLWPRLIKRGERIKETKTQRKNEKRKKKLLKAEEAARKRLELRIISQDDEVVVIEQSPRLVTTMWDIGKYYYTLAFPFVIFVVRVVKNQGGFHFKHVFVYYRKERLYDYSQELYYPNLPNLHSNCLVCLGARVPSSRSSVETAKNAVQTFWATVFNNDLPHHFIRAQKLDERLESVLSWEQASKKNWKFILNVPWKQACNLKDAIARCNHLED